MMKSIKYYLKYLFLTILTISLLIIPVHSLAQTTQKAAVVIDGKEIFFIRGFDNLTATERAKIINENLEKELNYSQPISLDIIQSNQQTVIRNKTTENILLTVTKNDVIETTNILSQAIFWQDKLNYALKIARLERSSAYLRQAFLYITIVVIVGLILQLLLGLLKKYCQRQILFLIEHKFTNFHPWQSQFQLLLKLTILAIKISLWLAIFYYITDILPQFRSSRYTLINFLSSPIFSLGKSEYSAIGLVLLLSFTIAIWFISKALTQLFKAYFLSQTGVDSRAQEVIGIISQYVFTFFSLIILWQLWGLDVGSLTILASVLGVGIGFGLQNIANDFISGLIITFERPIQLGDFVNVGNLSGIVERIGARSTEIRTLDHVSIIVPNSRFLVNEVINWTHNDPISRIKIPVGVSYGSDTERVKMALLEAARSHPEVLLRPRPQVWFKEFADSSLNFELLVWTGDPKKQFIIKSDLNYRIEAALRRYQLEVPFPQRDVNLKSPQLDLLITALLEKYGVNSPKKTSEIPLNLTNLSASLGTISNLEPQELPYQKIESLIEKMKANLEIKTRRYRLKTYPNCFISSEAIDFLMEEENFTREQAIDFGQMLLDRGIINNINNDRFFEDGYFLYSFTE